MSALRFPKDDGAFVVLDMHAVHAQDATIAVRVSVRHVVMYRPAGDGSSLVMEGRPGMVRVTQSCEQLDSLFARSRPAPVDRVARPNPSVPS